MANREHETVVVGNKSGAGWFVAILLLLVLAAGGAYLYSTGALDGQKDINVNIELPKVPGAN